jgi:FtsP/CotA-like multicopper oxidase with cupredoxin domain
MRSMRAIHGALPPVMVAALFCLGCAPDAVVAPGQPSGADAGARPRTRRYFVAAEVATWDYAPSGENLITGDPFSEAEEIFTEPGEGRIGRVYLKALYREYTDESFATPKPRPPEWEHLGILGPVIRGQVGDTIEVVFRNKADRPYTMHPHGLLYDKRSEGAPYDDGTSGDDKSDDGVPPGGTHTYSWPVPERAGPGPNDPSSILWMYHSHLNEPKDANAGLIGPIIITQRGKARDDGRPADVDREFVNLFMIHDENSSWYLDENVARSGADPSSEEFEESNLKHGINGLIYGNLPMMAMRRGEQVRWYMLGFGNEVDLHTPHWHGQSLLWLGMRTDIVELLPASMKVLDMVPDNPGVWLYHCHVHDHIDGGMIARFSVEPSSAAGLLAKATAWRRANESSVAPEAR